MPCVDMIGTGRNIATMCKAKGIKAKDIANKIGVSDVAVSKWKNGKAIPTIDNVVILAHIFGVTINDIIVIKTV